MKKICVGSVLLASLLLSAVDCNPQLCRNILAWANILSYNGNLNEKSYDEMYVIAHGTESSKKCNYMKAFVTQLGFGDICGHMLLAACPIESIETPKMRGLNIKTLNNEPFICPVATPNCNSTDLYRSIDGSCNNLANPHWGMAITAQRRHMPNAYDDGYETPRTKGCFGDLPSARHVSNVIHASRKQMKLETNLSYLFVQMGQFLSHDFVETKLFTRSDGDPLKCCFQDKNHSQCNPIKVPEDDVRFSPGGCLNFARSNSLFDCSFIRQPINSQTSYLDLSMTYAPSDKESATLRSFVGGKMHTVRNKLPVDFADKTCSLSVPIDPLSYYCPMSGDGRLNEQPGLASLHTIFVREHNRLVDGLSRVNPHWNDQRLYEEARKINIGVWQHVVYSEYLPLILNEKTMTEYGLHVKPQGYQDFYNTTTDASVSNAFAVAVFRFGHSQVHNVIGMIDKNSKQVLKPDPLERHFFDPAWYHAFNYSGLENVIRWSSSVGCPFTDRVTEDSIRSKLFQDENLESSDLIAMNIHRGRDHGTPGYTAFRRWCKLSPVMHFEQSPGGLVDHDSETAQLLKKTYSCPDDIDLFTGFLSEKRSNGSILGPTGQCLLAAEFQRLRNGDRFFYERRDLVNPSIGFTEGLHNKILLIVNSSILKTLFMIAPDKTYTKIRLCFVEIQTEHAIMRILFTLPIYVEIKQIYEYDLKCAMRFANPCFSSTCCIV